MFEHPTRYLRRPSGTHARPRAIELRQLTLVRAQRTLLADVTLDIFEGESVALLGPPASGKSALLACIQGVLQPDGGEVRVLGAPLASLPAAVRRRIGVLPRHFAPGTQETAAAYLQRFAAYHDVTLTGGQLATYCAHYKIDPAFPVAAFSGREACIFALALALVHDPRLVLLDEPLGGLSAVDQAAIWPYLQRIQREGRTLLCTFSEHTFWENKLSAIFDRVISI